MSRPKIASKSYRMSPAEFLDNPHREILSSQVRPKRVVVTYRCYSAKKVANAAPPEAHIFGHRPVLCYYIGELAVYVLSPIDVVLIGRICQPGKEGQMQMVVRVDESGQNQETTEIDLGTARCHCGR